MPVSSTEVLAPICETTTAICALPSVATVDWFDRAAAALCQAAPDSTCVMTLLSSDAPGTAVADAVGVWTRGGTTDDDALATLRSRAHRLGAAGMPVGPDGAPRDIADSMNSLAPGWREGPVGKLWAGFGIHELFCTIAALPGVAARTLLAYVGVPAPAPGATTVLQTVTPLLVQRAVRGVGATLADHRSWLTLREQEVLDQLTLGRSVKQIAQALGRSPHTVHDHVKALHRKLSANTRGELIARALGHIRSVTPERPSAVASQVESKTRAGGAVALRHDQPGNHA